MQRLFLFIPIAFLFFINSCAVMPPPDGSDPVQNAVAETLTAIAATDVPTLTPHPSISNLIGVLNNDLSTTNPLGRTLDAEYLVVNMSFSYASNGVLFQVDVGCICMNSDKCCNAERTFVVLANSMKTHSSTVVSYLAPNISQIVVVCVNQQSKQPVGAVTVSWPDMQGYLQGHISGEQLGMRVKPTSVP